MGYTNYILSDKNQNLNVYYVFRIKNINVNKSNEYYVSIYLGESVWQEIFRGIRQELTAQSKKRFNSIRNLLMTVIDSVAYACLKIIYQTKDIDVDNTDLDSREKDRDKHKAYTLEIAKIHYDGKLMMIDFYLIEIENYRRLGRISILLEISRHSK
jgi:hypothetical protein